MAPIITNVDERALRTTAFPSEFNTKVNPAKINLIIMKNWATEEVNRILGTEDDIITGMVQDLLDANPLDPKKMQVSLAGFLGEDCPAFVKKLWNLCLDAQSSPHGVAAEMLEAKKTELKLEKERRQKAMDDARGRDGRGDRDERRPHDVSHSDGGRRSEWQSSRNRRDVDSYVPRELPAYRSGIPPTNRRRSMSRSRSRSSRRNRIPNAGPRGYNRRSPVRERSWSRSRSRSRDRRRPRHHWPSTGYDSSRSPVGRRKDDRQKPHRSRRGSNSRSPRRRSPSREPENGRDRRNARRRSPNPRSRSRSHEKKEDQSRERKRRSRSRSKDAGHGKRKRRSRSRSRTRGSHNGHRRYQSRSYSRGRDDSPPSRKRRTNSRSRSRSRSSYASRSRTRSPSPNRAGNGRRMSKAEISDHQVR